MSDYLEQQIPFGMYINESVKSGQVYWSWGMDLGTNFIGAFFLLSAGQPVFLAVYAVSFVLVHLHCRGHLPYKVYGGRSGGVLWLGGGR